MARSKEWATRTSMGSGLRMASERGTWREWRRRMEWWRRSAKRKGLVRKRRMRLGKTTGSRMTTAKKMKLGSWRRSALWRPMATRKRMESHLAKASD